MRIILSILLAGLAFCCAAPARAQDTATVVSSCGTLPLAYVAGGVRPLTMDTTGKLCDTGSGGSGGAVTPTGKTTTQAKVTIAVTNTYQQALASSSSRSGCLIQNNGTHTMYVFFGSAPADTTTSFQLTAGQGISCAAGGVIVATDAVQITGTASDVAVVSNQ